MATTRRVSRDDVVRLGQSGRPWEFLPACWQVLRIAPADLGLRLLSAANLARLGLKTVAIEELAHFDASGTQGHEEVEALRAACEALPEDRIPLEALAAMAAMNLEVISGRAGLQKSMDRWLAGNADVEWYRTLDGNIVRRRRGPGGAWTAFGDHRGAAERFAGKHLVRGASGSEGLASMYTVEGIDPPWVLLKVVAITARQKDGFWPLVNVVQADPLEFLDGIACTDLREVLSQERLQFHIGADAALHLREDLRGRLEAQVSGPCIPLATLRTPAGAAGVIEEVQREQVEEHARLVEEVGAIYGRRDRGWWRRRFASGLAGVRGGQSRSAEPLRIVVPTTRYSTYLQYSSADLVEALRSMGYEAELLIEPDDSSRLSSLAYLNVFRRFQPDLVILINHFRGSLGECIPKEVPFVCWVQDAMPHQFDARAGSKQSALDFIAGHLHPEMFSRCNFRREQAVAFPVVVSRTKFHDGPVDAGLRERFACEVALVSHHSETPERMHARLVMEARASAGGDVVRLLEGLREPVIAIGEDPMGLGDGGRRSQWERLHEAVAGAIQERTGLAASEAQMTPIFRQYALPLAERVLRHQTIRWAAQVCEKRGWRLALHGRGWEQAEEFCAYARGEASHGEELRAIYQCAAVQLHISATALVHQRVMECALSGGLPVCRLVRAEIQTIVSAAQRRAQVECEARACEVGTRRLGRPIADNPGLMSMAALLHRLGEDAPGHDGLVWANPPQDQTLAPANIMAMERRADWVFGDLSQVSFQSIGGLEAVIDRAVNRPEWRRAMSKWIAGRIRERLTHQAFMAAVFGLVERSLERE